MVMVEPTTTFRFSTGSCFHRISRLLSHSGGTFFIPGAGTNFRIPRLLSDGSWARKTEFFKSRVRASGSSMEDQGSGSLKPNAKPQRYHPFEDIVKSELVVESGEEARLTPAETTRTIIEVNNKATLMFSGIISDDVHENIFWPDLPYLTDEHGNIYFQVKNDEDVLQTLTSDDNLVQVIVGLNTAETISEMESLGQSEIDFGVEEFDDEDIDEDEDDDDSEDEDDEDGHSDEDWVTILDEEEDQDEDSDGSLGDWAKLETMRSSHPMYFAKTLAEVVTNDPIDCMDQPPACLAIQGLLRPAFIEDHTVIQKHMSDHQSSSADTYQIAKLVEDKEEDIVPINGHKHEPGSSQDSPIPAEELEKDESLGTGTVFYKLEMIKIQLISALGNQTFVEVEDFRRARPDAIAHSAAKIISRLEVGGEKTTQALKSLCWRSKGIQVEEVALISVDSLGFDLRVCSGTQVQTLRFAFNQRGSSEYSAERQLNDLLFPRTHHKLQKRKAARQTEP